MTNKIVSISVPPYPLSVLRQACNWAAMRNINLGFHEEIGILPTHLDKVTLWTKDPTKTSINPVGALILMTGVFESDHFGAAQTALGEGLPFTIGVIDALAKKPACNTWLATNAKDRYKDGWQTGEKIRKEYDRSR